jgi:hypothetical protein
MPRVTRPESGASALRDVVHWRPSKSRATNRARDKSRKERLSLRAAILYIAVILLFAWAAILGALFALI